MTPGREGRRREGGATCRGRARSPRLESAADRVILAVVELFPRFSQLQRGPRLQEGTSRSIALKCMTR